MFARCQSPAFEYIRKATAFASAGYQSQAFNYTFKKQWASCLLAARVQHLNTFKKQWLLHLPATRVKHLITHLKRQWPSCLLATRVQHLNIFE
jgi:hypothetical protein